jgi:DNA-directed RNA polymerase specialized sigma24 family protein
LNKTATIQSIQNQDERVIQRIYGEFKPKFENWLKGKYKIGEEEACSEIYQRSFTVLFFNAKRGKLDNLDASIETYLFGIGKMIVKEWWRERGQENKTVDIEDREELEQVDLMNNSFNGNEIDDDRKRKLAHAINNMGDPCKTILTLFYWERNSMEAIANKTGYKNEQGAKKKKYLCLKKLKELMDA